ncbi:MAG: hypothetical protein RAP41_05580 [Candidatus Orphnella occulta]|nr:hypothetical protein [Candidatus Orphnella occulta]
MTKMNISAMPIAIMLVLFFVTGCQGQGGDGVNKPSGPIAERCTPEEEAKISNTFANLFNKATGPETFTLEGLDKNQIKEVLSPIASKLIADTLIIVNKDSKKTYYTADVVNALPLNVYKVLHKEGFDLQPAASLQSPVENILSGNQVDEKKEGQEKEQEVKQEAK